MLHPSPVAISYLWECFTDCYFSKETDRIMKEWEDIRKALAHKPFNAQSETYRKFLTQNNFSARLLLLDNALRAVIEPLAAERRETVEIYPQE